VPGDNFPHGNMLQYDVGSVIVHLTSLLGSSATVAVSWIYAFGFTEGADGEIVTLARPGGKIVTVAVAFLVESATAVAFKTTAAGFGTVVGARYVTEGVPAGFVRVPQLAPLQPEPESVQVTPLAETSLSNVVLNSDWLVVMLALLGLTATVILGVFF
jgi:hypothetical protein